MPSILEQVTERLRQTRAAQSLATRNSPRAASSAAARLGLPLLPGDRVFDTVTGLEGDVIDGLRDSGSGVVSLHVRLTAGAAVWRRLDELIARPTLPAGRN